MTLDRSPEVLFKTSNLYISIKTDHALDEPLAGGIFVPRAPFGANLNTIHCGYQGPRLSGFKPGDFVCFNL